MLSNIKFSYVLRNSNSVGFRCHVLALAEIIIKPDNRIFLTLIRELIIYYLLNQTNSVTELHPAIMALSESDRDADLINQSETDDDMLHRLATPTDNPEEGDNPSDEIRRCQ